MTKITLDTLLTADGTYYVDIGRAAYFRVQVGSKQNKAFGGGNVSVKQEGLTYDGLSAVTAVTAKILLLKPGPLEFKVDGSTSPSLAIFVDEVKNAPTA
jgi:hypothetical protein